MLCLDWKLKWTCISSDFIAPFIGTILYFKCECKVKLGEVIKMPYCYTVEIQCLFFTLYIV